MRTIYTILLISCLTSLHAQVEQQPALDPARVKVDSIRASKLSVLDSAELKMNKAASKAKSIIKPNLHRTDTLGQYKHAPQATIDKQKTKITAKIDSLKSRGLPHDKYSHKLDSLNRMNPMDKVQQAQSKVDQGQSKIQQLQQAPEGKVNEKLNLLSKESQGKGTLPSNVHAPDARLPDTKLNIDKPDIPQIEKPALDLKDNPLSKDVNTKLAMPKDMKKPDELNRISEVQNKATGNIDNVTQKASGYSSDVKNISKGNVDEVNTLKQDALSKASLDKEMGELKKAEQAMADKKAQLEALKNKEEYKKQVLARAKEMSLKNLPSYDTKMQQAVNKVEKYKRTSGTILQHKKDLPKKRDPLRKLKFYEKFVPGLTLQAQKGNAWLLDVNPSLRYRLTSYWSIGSGWNDRLAIGKHTRTVEQTKMYGIRSFTEVIIFKGLSMRFDAERMNSFVTPFLQPKDAGTRQWVWNYLAGLKKEFTFMPRVSGNVQFMYNLYDPHYHRVYPARFNVRFGFEFPLQKRKGNRKNSDTTEKK